MTDLPPIVRAWVEQLLDPAFLSAITAMPVDRVDVRLSGSGGKVRRPVIVLNGGPGELIDP